MKLNHLNLAVPEVLTTAAFFEEFFGFHRVEVKGAGTLAVLRDEAGFCLILSNFDRKTKPEYPKDFHIGFIQETKEQVTAIYERLVAGGHHVKAAPHGMHGSWGFYFHAPGEIFVEVSCPVE